MDPTANILEQERLRDSIRYATDFDVRRADRARLRELDEALRGWVARGGFLPDFSKAPKTAKYYGVAS